MLAPTQTKPAILNISDEEFVALVKVLGMLERGELRHGKNHARGGEKLFNMGTACREDVDENHQCGTVACIGGWAATLMGKNHWGAMRYVLRRGKRNSPLHALYYPPKYDMNCITTEQAAQALRNFLFGGKADPDWASVMGY